MSDGMDEIIEDFITEAEESLEKIDPLFVELEEKGHDPELLNSIFRSMHTIKGAAGFLGSALPTTRSSHPRVAEQSVEGSLAFTRVGV